jgi:threonine dehydrogenase-like Zn-dependent dehydrogenase
MIKCLVYSAPGEPEFICVERKYPNLNQVGVRIIASSLCNTSEMRSFKGGYESGYGSGYPMRPGEPGHEAVGIIENVGKDVVGFSVGDIIAMTGHGGDPCHRSYVIRNTDDIARIKQDGRNIEAAAMLEMYGCAYHCAVAPGSLGFYEDKRVLVVGLGSMGLCTTQILSGIKNIEITAVDINEERLDKAKECGADISTTPDKADVKYDAVIECSGTVKGQELAFTIAPKTLIFSSYNTKEISLRQNLLFDSQTTIYNPGIPTSANFKRATALYNEGRIDPSLLITGRIKANIDGYMNALEDIRNGKTIKTLMMW